MPQYPYAQSIQPDTRQLAGFCKKWKVSELALFGSVLRPDFNPESDIDILVSFTPDAAWGLWDHVQMEQELTALFGRDVDLISRRAVEQSKNHIRRREILNNAQILYALTEAVYAAR